MKLFSNSLLLAAAGVAALSLSASAQETPGSSPAPKMKVHWTESEKMFATKASGGNLAEVKMGELAASKASSADVKSFGQQMVTDHGKANSDLQAVLDKKGMPFAPKLNEKQQMSFDKLSKLDGDAFDKAYVTGMLKDHMMDASEYKMAMKSTKDTDLKEYETATLPVIEHHLKMVEDLKKAEMPAKKS